MAPATTRAGRFEIYGNTSGGSTFIISTLGRIGINNFTPMAMTQITLVRQLPEPKYFSGAPPVKQSDMFQHSDNTGAILAISMRTDSCDRQRDAFGSPLYRWIGANASATHAELNLYNTALSGASANGTYIGANPASASADFINYQVGGTTKFSVDKNGVITGNGSGITGISGTISGLTAGRVTLSTGGTTIGDSANLTFNSATGAFGIGGTAPAISSSGALGISAGGSNQNITLTPSGTGVTAFNGNVQIGSVAAFAPLTLTNAGHSMTGTIFQEGVFDNATGSSGVWLGYDSSGTTGVVAADTAVGASNLAFATYSGSAWTENMFISGNGNVGIGAAGVDTLSIATAPTASATHALVNVTNTALVGASGSGTYIGANPASAGADFMNYQVGGATKFKVDANGVITGNGSGLTGVTPSFSGLTTGGVMLSTSPTAIGQDGSNFFWDSTNHRLGVGTSAPTTMFQMGTSGSTGTASIYGRIGVNTNSPQFMADIRGTSSASGDIQIANNDFVIGSAGSSLVMGPFAATGTTYEVIQAYNSGDSAYGSLALNPSGGSVGIGTGSPVDFFPSAVTTHPLPTP